MTQTTNLSLGNEPTGVAFPSDPLDFQLMNFTIMPFWLYFLLFVCHFVKTFLELSIIIIL
jgi:hypothetical protein